MKLQAISFGTQVGGVAFLASIATDIVELCFEDNGMKKENRETLFVAVMQYEDSEDIIVSERPVFGAFVDSDAEFDDEYVDENTIDRYGDMFDEDYHASILENLADSPFGKEIALARHALDLFKQERYGDLGERYGVEADEFDAPEVEYDIPEDE